VLQYAVSIAILFHRHGTVCSLLFRLHFYWPPSSESWKYSYADQSVTESIYFFQLW